mmetsp:Transcript_51130/g.136501  ORF Transcript_51130/g.136501 Transcript_51130/m.136501 type:complete len:92 (+) Transcript_51130:1924-2199(+)
MCGRSGRFPATAEAARVFGANPSRMFSLSLQLELADEQQPVMPWAVLDVEKSVGGHLLAASAPPNRVENTRHVRTRTTYTLGDLIVCEART